MKGSLFHEPNLMISKELLFFNPSKMLFSASSLRWQQPIDDR